MRFLSITLNFCQLSLSATVGLTGSSIILWYLDQKEHLLTLRHVGIFLILFQWMGKKNILPKISHTWKGRGTLNENSLCTAGNIWNAINCQCTTEQTLEPRNQDCVWARMCSCYSTCTTRISDSVCSSPMSNKYFTIWVCVYYIRI